MVAISMPLADAVCADLYIGFPVRDINTLSVGENIVTMMSKERSKHGRGGLIVSGAV